MESMLFNHYSTFPILMLHPNSHGYRALLPVLMERKEQTVIFLTIPANATTAQVFSELLCQALSGQIGKVFAPFDGKQGLQRWSRSFVQTMKSISPYLLIIDAIDYLDDAQATPIFRALVEAEMPGSQTILFGRRIPATLFMDAALLGKVALLPIDEDGMFLDYMRPREKRILVEIHAFGQGRAVVRGTPVQDWGGHLPRALFLYMADKVMATRDSIFEAFWPSLHPRQATNVFHVTKRKIKEILDVDLTEYTSGYYRIATNLEVHYDVFKFIEAIQQAETPDEQSAIAHLERAVSLYRGNYLMGMTQPWAVQRRSELRSSYGEALRTLSGLYNATGHDARASGLAARAQAFAPQTAAMGAHP